MPGICIFESPDPPSLWRVSATSNTSDRSKSSFMKTRRVKIIFWNNDQRRLRAGWRLLIQFVLFFALLVLAVFLDNFIDDLFGQLPRHPWFGKGDSILLPMEMLAATLLSMWFSGRFLDRRRFSDFGVRFSSSWWVDLGFGFVLGAILMGIIFLIHLGMDWAIISGTLRSEMPGATFRTSMLLAVGSIICMAAQEELHSRGYQLKNLAEGLNSPRLGSKAAAALAVVIIAISFGAFHYDADAGMISVYALIIAGLLYAVSFALTGELAIPIGFHIAWNFFEGCVFGFPVSGVDMGANFIALQETGPDLWTGGAFGPETGLLGIFGHLLGLLFIVVWVRYRRGKIDVQERLLTPTLLAGKNR